MLLDDSSQNPRMTLTLRVPTTLLCFRMTLPNPRIILTTPYMNMKDPGMTKMTLVHPQDPKLKLKDPNNQYHANRLSLAQVILLLTGNLEDDAILPVAFRENSVVRLLYPRAVIILSFSGPYSFFFNSPC